MKLTEMPAGRNAMNRLGGWLSAVVLLGATMVNPSACSAETAEAAPTSHTMRRLTPEERTTVELFQRACHGVVFVTTLVANPLDLRLDPLEVPDGQGSGFVWDERGYIVTNFHVVEGADVARVTLHGRSTWRARLVGVAPEKDLAVLRIDAPVERLHPLPIGESHDNRSSSERQEQRAAGSSVARDLTIHRRTPKRRSP